MVTRGRNFIRSADQLEAAIENVVPRIFILHGYFSMIITNGGYSKCGIAYYSCDASLREMYAQILRPPNIFYLADYFEELELIRITFGPWKEGILLPRRKTHVASQHQLEVIPRKIFADEATQTQTKQTKWRKW